MAHALGLQRLDLYLQYDRPLGGSELDAVRTLVRARGDRKPVAYLVGERGFYSLSFHVDERVLVPRPETEHLVEVAVDALRAQAAPVFADIGTGSGCIAVAVLSEVTAARALATDVSGGALDVARGNAERHGVLERIELLAGDLLEPLRSDVSWGALDAVLSNPPYVVRGDPALEADVREHEPELALYVPGEDPLAVAREVARQSLEGLRSGGLVALEVGAGSAASAREMLRDLGYVDIETQPDLSSIERVVSGRKP